MCKPHILNDFDCKGEFPVDIIEPYTIYDNESGQLAKIKGFWFPLIFDSSLSGCIYLVDTVHQEVE